ncbi:MAG: hypothetical protein HGB08_02635 [Candidatus Moranbacteria bacterium]|nr:hypothetical protein [Candidatus Moranbacteria bacterium]
MAILGLVTLSFDPMASDHPEMRKIIGDELAMKIFLALQNQGFEAFHTFMYNVLQVASEVSRLMAIGELNKKRLYWLLHDTALIEVGAHEFAEELFKLIINGESIQYQVEEA